MAKGKSNLIVEIGGQLAASFKKTIRSTQRSVSSLSKNISRDINNAAAGASKGFKNVLRNDAFQGAAVAAGGLALAMRKAVRTAADFEQGMAKVKAVTTPTGKEFKQLSNLAKEMGATTKFTAAEAAAGMEMMGRAGYSTTQIMAGLGPMLQAASAEGMELKSVSDIVSNIVGSNKLLVSDTAQVADTLAQTSRSANTNIGELGEAFRTIGPVGVNAGLSLQELAASFGVLSDSGIKGSEAGTAFKTMLSRLAAPASDAQKILDKLGVATNDANGNLRPMNTIMGDITSSMERLNLGTGEQNKALQKIFGLRAVAAASVLMEANANGKLAEKIATVNDHQGAAAEMSKTLLNTFEGQMTLMNSAFDGLMLSLGAPLLKPLVSVMQTLAKIAKPIGDLLTDMPILATVVGIASAAFIGFVAVLPIIGALSGGLMAVTGAATAGAAAMMLITSPVTLTIAGIIGLIAVFSLLYNRVDWFKNAVDGTLNFLGNAWNALSTGISAAWNATMDALMPGIEAFKKIFGGVVQYIQGIFQVFWGLLSGDSQMAVDGVSNIFGGLKNIFGGIVDGIGASFNLLVGIVSGITTQIVGFFTALPGQLLNVGGAIIDTIKEGFMSRFNALKDTVVKSFKELRKLLPFSDAKKGPFKDLTASGRAIVTTLAQGVRDRESVLRNAIGNTAAMAMDGFSPAFEPMAMASPAFAMPGGGSFAAPAAPAAPTRTRGDDGNGVFGFLHKLLPIAGALIPGASQFTGMARGGLNLGEEMIHGDGLKNLRPMAAAASIAPVINITAQTDASPEDIARVVVEQVQGLMDDSEAGQRAGLND